MCKTCENWACVDIRTRLVLGHHPGCPELHKKSLFDGCLDLIAELAKAMEVWSRDEDGIHPAAWPAYRKAKALQGVFLPENPDEEVSCSALKSHG